MTATVARPGRRLPPLLRQSAHHGLVLAAAALALLLAVTVLAALVAVAEQAAETGARERLAADPDAAVRISGAYDPDGVARADSPVRGALARTYGEVAHRTTRLVRAPAAREQQLPVAASGVGGRGAVGLSLLWAQDADRQARLTEGEWPRAGDTAAGGPVEVALDEGYAARLGLTTGDGFALGGDEDAAAEGGGAADEAAAQPLAVRVSGLYVPRDPDAPLWQDLTGTFGTPDSVGLVARRTFAEQPALRRDATAGWLAVPDARRLRLGQVDPLRERAVALAAGDAERVVFGRAAARQGVLADVEADTDLPYALRQLDVPVAVARAGTYLPVALLASLALAALVLTARQLARHRAAEQALLGSRGAGPLRLVGGATAQWAAVALPAALAGPYLAGPLLRGLAAAGLLDGPVPRTAATGAGWTVAALALAVHAAAALTPVARAARDRRAVARLRRRVPRLAAYQRAGRDLALAGVAAVGWLQLVTYRTPVADSGTVDPVVVLAPVALTAATVLLALRLLPLAARAADRLGRRSAGLVLPLGGWHLGRRAAGHAGPALLVALALAIAALGATALAVLDRGDRDQAAFAVGADLGVEAGQEGAGFVPRAERHARYRELPGIAAATPVVDWDVTVGTSFAGMTALDSAEVLPTLRTGGTAGPVPAVRDGAGLPHDALAALGGTRPVPAHGLSLSGRPDALGMRVRLDADGPGTAEPFTLTATLEDADGLAHTVSGTLPPADGRAHRMSIPLGAYQHPLRLTGLQLRTDQEKRQRTYRLTIDDFAGVPNGHRAGWQDLIGGERPDRGLAGCPGRTPAPTRGMPPRRATGFVLCEARTTPGALFDGVLRGPDTSLPAELLSWQLQLGLTGQGKPRPVPVLATDALLAGGQAEVGESLRAGLPGGTELRARVVGSIDAVPGTDPGRGRLLVDTRVLAAYLVRAGLDPPVESHWWLAARGGDAGAARRAVERRPELGTARDVPGERAELAASPLREGTDGALRLCLVLAPAFAVVGFALHSVLAVRARAREFALLRALGVRARQLTALLWTEQLCLAAFAAAVGTATGVALAAAVVPAVTVTETGAAVHPELTVAVPWLRVAAVAAAVTALICLAVTATARALARMDLARVLRAGDE
ncbi:FtsX-like permease family protein [Streptomyces sp. WMMC500]|uniref:FtsX-like permease family protein n=1 Tax=Streptomyces sp. WMMC500 TaxID=3015154 RepID=UPI00248C845C|nr:FtsX-like permease family protein [Streptomyces sp. WMMC500]WBB62582.1 FtsX-like permease family protein [Streptomyces sp. WMMC500]